MRNQFYIKIIEWALRINVVIKLSLYGLGKIIGQQFYRKGSVPEIVGSKSLAETSGYDLAWTFFGYADGYIWFIGLSQLMGAALLLFPKTKLLGGAILVPILLNIIMVDSLFGVAYGALFSACFYLASILFMFYIYKEEVISAVKKLWLTTGSLSLNKKRHWIWSSVFILVAVVVIFYIEYLGIALFGYEDRHY